MHLSDQRVLEYSSVDQVIAHLFLILESGVAQVAAQGISTTGRGSRDGRAATVEDDVAAGPALRHEVLDGHGVAGWMVSRS